MEKHEAIYYILQELKKGRVQEEIALDLSERLDSPFDLVNKFVARTISAYTPPVSTRKNAAPPTKSSDLIIQERHSVVQPVTFRKLSPNDYRIRLDELKSKYHPIPESERYKIWLWNILKRTRENWKVFSQNRLAILGVAFLIVYFLMAIIHPILLKTVWSKTIYDPIVGFDMKVYLNPSPPSRNHLLGTDTLGRDVLSLLMAATRPSLLMAITAALTAAAVGTFIGALSAYFRGVVDGFFAHLADISLLAPAPVVMVIIGFVLDIDPFKFGLIYGILVGIGAVAIVLRSHALSVMSKTFIQAARVSGGGSLHIIFQHLIPHMLPLAAINMLLTVTGAVFANGFIAFLGLSRAQLNWGSMIYDAFTYEGINGILPWNVLIPSALAISLFAASFYLIALGLQDVVEPRLISSKRLV
jgi:ABC-type dipeptide/oligopeptide/nickel transport system permease subunit